MKILTDIILWLKRSLTALFLCKKSAKRQEYREYIQEHKENVMRAWKVMQERCKDEYFICDDWKFFHLDAWVKRHDDSKYSREEFEAYRRWFSPTKREKKRKERYAAKFQEALSHHYENNPHHWQYWIGKPTKGYMGCLEKTLFHVEMVLDWTAMGYKFGDTALQYYKKHKGEIQISPDKVEFVERLLLKMDGGESA